MHTGAREARGGGTRIVIGREPYRAHAPDNSRAYSSLSLAASNLYEQTIAKVYVGYEERKRAAGAGNVVEVPRYTIAEDFSQFSNVVPGLYFFVGTTPRGQDLASAPMNHSPLYAPDESALDLGVRAMLQATVDFLEGAASAR